MSFLAIPKTKKKFWIFLAIAGLAVFLFALSASASITYSRTPSGANPPQTTFHFFVTGDTSACALAYLRIPEYTGVTTIPIPTASSYEFIVYLAAKDYSSGVWLEHSTALYQSCDTPYQLEGAFSVVGEILPTPIPEAIVFQILNDTETYTTENPYPFTYSYRPLERFTPLADTQVCSLDTKIQRIDHGESTTGDFMIVSLFSGGLATPSFANTLFQTQGYFPIASLSFVGDYISYTHFDFGGCYDLTAGVNYWFLMGTYGNPHEIRHYGRASYQNYARSSAAKYSGASDTWIIIPNFDLSLRLLNYNYQTPAPAPPSPSPPSTASYGFENKDFGLLGNMFRDVIVWLFFPDQANLERFGNLWDTIRLKPPIGYFTAAKDELSLVGVGSASIAFNTTAAAGIINPLRTGIIVILWVLFAFWIFHRLRNLDL